MTDFIERLKKAKQYGVNTLDLNIGALPGTIAVLVKGTTSNLTLDIKDIINIMEKYHKEMYLGRSILESETEPIPKELITLSKSKIPEKKVLAWIIDSWHEGDPQDRISEGLEDAILEKLKVCKEK